MTYGGRGTHECMQGSIAWISRLHAWHAFAVADACLHYSIFVPFAYFRHWTAPLFCAQLSSFQRPKPFTIPRMQTTPPRLISSGSPPPSGPQPALLASLAAQLPGHAKTSSSVFPTSLPLPAQKGSQQGPAAPATDRIGIVSDSGPNPKSQQPRHTQHHNRAEKGRGAEALKAQEKQDTKP